MSEKHDIESAMEKLKELLGPKDTDGSEAKVIHKMSGMDEEERRNSIKCINHLQQMQQRGLQQLKDIFTGDPSHTPPQGWEELMQDFAFWHRHAEYLKERLKVPYVSRMYVVPLLMGLDQMDDLLRLKGRFFAVSNKRK